MLGRATWSWLRSPSWRLDSPGSGCNETSTFRSGRLFPIFTAAASLLGLVVATLQRLTNLRLNLIAIGTTLLVAIGDEMVFRGFLLNALAQRMALPIAVIVSGLVFGSAHFVNIVDQPLQTTLIQIAQDAITVIASGWTYILSRGNLVLVIILH
jgi:membrane protease YdiL (CAAX protease family)